MKPFYSIVIPVYNAELYIAEAINSALSQIGVTAEVIVVNDGSTDRTLEVVAGYGEKIRVVSQSNRGISAARDSGVLAAKGNLIAFLDSDDIWSPNKLLVQSEKVRLGYKLVYSNRINFGNIGDLPEIQSDAVQMYEGDLWEKLLSGNMITTSSVVIERDLYHETGGFKEGLRYCEDWDLWLRCAEAHPIGYCPEPLVKYRLSNNSLSSSYVYMAEKRLEVITSALASERGSRLSMIKRRRILAKTWATSAWDAARNKDLHLSLGYYQASLLQWPFDASILYDVARVIAGRA